MLTDKQQEEDSSSGSSGQLQPPMASTSRRASEGGPNVYSSPKGTFKWTNQPANDVISKFRNYEI